MSLRRLDQKLTKIANGSYKPTDFILADAKDGEMGGGIQVAGWTYDADNKINGHKPYSTYKDAIIEMTKTDLVDIMLMAPSMSEKLHRTGLFHGSQVTPAMRLNEATDIWGCRGSSYNKEPARNFRTADLELGINFADLGLYSVTFYNDLEIDTAALDGYSQFRDEARDVGMRHFLEVFAPAFEIDNGNASLADYMNDCIVRCLAGVFSVENPLFLKMPFLGAKAMEDLASYDPQRIIVGILGGSAGTARDTFELLSQAERYGGRAALFGRKINLAESPVTLVRLMRRVVESDISTTDAVKTYHDELKRQGIRSLRSLEDDLQITEEVLKAEAQG